MNPTPPQLPFAQSPAGFPFAAPGDLPPLNARFAAYLDESVEKQTRRRILWLGILTVFTALLTLFAVFLSFVKNADQGRGLFPLGLILAVQCGRGLHHAFQEQKKQEQTRRVVHNGVPVVAYLVQANGLLFSPGKHPSLPCLVLFSFQSEVADDSNYMVSLAQKVFRHKNTTPPDADGQTVAELTTEERAVYHRRRKLPFSFTDGSTVYCADLWIKRADVPGGFLQERQMLCLAEPGENGGLELVPSFLL